MNEKNKNETISKLYDDEIERALQVLVPDYSYFFTNDY